MAKNAEMTPKTNGTTAQRFDPWERFTQLQREIEHLWMDSWPFTPRLVSRVPVMAEAYVPAMDVYEKNGNLVLKAELAGISPDDVEITIEEGHLIVKGEKKAEKEVKEKDYYRMERSYGSFYRTMTLPEGVKPEQIHATFKDGVLEISVPKPVEKKSEGTKIPIVTM